MVNIFVISGLRKMRRKSKFLDASYCGCEECVIKSFSYNPVSKNVDAEYNPEDYKDDDGWF